MILNSAHLHISAAYREILGVGLSNSKNSEFGSILSRPVRERFIHTSVSGRDNEDLLGVGATDYHVTEDNSVVAEKILNIPEDSCKFYRMYGYSISPEGVVSNPTESIYLKDPKSGESYLIGRSIYKDDGTVVMLKPLGSFHIEEWGNGNRMVGSLCAVSGTEAFYWVEFNNKDEYRLLSSKRPITRKYPYVDFNEASLNLSEKIGNTHPNILLRIVELYKIWFKLDEREGVDKLVFLNNKMRLEQIIERLGVVSGFSQDFMFEYWNRVHA